jgi:hypothetical protein
MSADVLAGRIAATGTGTGWVPQPCSVYRASGMTQLLTAWPVLVAEGVAQRGWALPAGAPSPPFLAAPDGERTARAAAASTSGRDDVSGMGAVSAAATPGRNGPQS